MKKIKKFALFSSLILGSALSCVSNPIICSFASGEELVPSIDLTTPTDDLFYDDTFRESYDNGVYNFGTHDKCVVLNFYEYGYKREYSKDYGLYVYIFNPFESVGINEVGKNKIEIGFSQDDSEDAIEDIPYNKYDLIFVSKTIDDTDRNKFYKFKVNIDEDFYNHLVDKEKRIYAVSGVEIQMDNKTTPTDLLVSSKFVYTGFGANCDGNNESSLDCKKVGLDTIEFTLRGGYKRSGFVNEAVTQQKDLHYVYFNIPNKYERKYGSLYSVKFDGYRYDFTQPVYVWDTSKSDIKANADLAHTFKFYDPVNFGNTAETQSVLDEPYKLAGYMDSSGNWVDNDSYDPDYMIGSAFVNTLPKERLFYTNNIETPIDNSVIEERYLNNISKYKYKKINIGDELSVDNYTKQTGTKPSASSSFFTDFFNLFMRGQTGLGRTADDSGVYWNELQALTPITNKESNDDGNTYFINKKDVTDFNKTLDDAKNNDKTMYLLRFDTSDYWTAPIAEQRASFWLWREDSQIRGYSSYFSAIVDFDIISLTFKGTRGMVVVPVCASPINIFPDFDNKSLKNDPNKIPTWLIIVLSVVGVGVVGYFGYKIYSKVTENKKNKLDYNLKKIDYEEKKNRSKHKKE